MVHSDVGLTSSEEVAVNSTEDGMIVFKSDIKFRRFSALEILCLVGNGSNNFLAADTSG